MTKNKRVETLDEKINKLRIRRKKLEEKRVSQLIKILSRCNAEKVPDEILAGGIFEVVKAYNQNDKKVSTWKLEGLKIIKPGRGRKRFV